MLLRRILRASFPLGGAARQMRKEKYLKRRLTALIAHFVRSLAWEPFERASFHWRKSAGEMNDGTAEDYASGFFRAEDRSAVLFKREAGTNLTLITNYHRIALPSIATTYWANETRKHSIMTSRERFRICFDRCLILRRSAHFVRLLHPVSVKSKKDGACRRPDHPRRGDGR